MFEAPWYFKNTYQEYKDILFQVYQVLRNSQYQNKETLKQIIQCYSKFCYKIQIELKNDHFREENDDDDDNINNNNDNNNNENNTDINNMIRNFKNSFIKALSIELKPTDIKKCQTELNIPNIEDFKFVISSEYLKNLSETDMEIFIQNCQIMKKNLKYLYIELGYNSYIQEKKLELFSQGLSYLENLVHFRLEIFVGNDFKDEGGYHLGSALKKLKKLKSFTISTGLNKFTDQGMKGLCSGISEMKNIQVLKIVLNQEKLTTNGFTEIGNAIQNLNDSLLDLNINVMEMQEYGSQDIELFAKGLGKLSNLQNLYLSIDEKCEIGVKGAVFLGQAFSNLENVEYMNISLDGMGVVGAKSIGQGISQLKKLKKQRLGLNLDSDEISQIALAEIIKDKDFRQKLNFDPYYRDNKKKNVYGEEGSCLKCSIF